MGNHFLEAGREGGTSEGKRSIIQRKIKINKRTGRGDKGRRKFEERVIGSVRHSERSNQIRLQIGLFDSVTSAIMTFC